MPFLGQFVTVYPFGTAAKVYCATGFEPGNKIKVFSGVGLDTLRGEATIRAIQSREDATVLFFEAELPTGTMSGDLIVSE